MIQISHDKYESDLSDAVAGVHSDKCDCSDGIFLILMMGQSESRELFWNIISISLDKYVFFLVRNVILVSNEKCE